MFHKTWLCASPPLGLHGFKWLRSGWAQLLAGSFFRFNFAVQEIAWRGQMETLKQVWQQHRGLLVDACRHEHTITMAQALITTMP